jgi:hypothetical protein
MEHAVERTYSGQGAKELVGVLEKNKTTIEQLIRGIEGFVSFSLVPTVGSPRTQERLVLRHRK